MESKAEQTLSEDQVRVERSLKFPISFGVASGDNDDDNTGENSNNTTDHIQS
jgi:hypothetical protein